MKTLTFLCVLVIGLSVYAETEAGLNGEGFGKKKPQRNLAAAVSDMSTVMAQLDGMNKGRSVKPIASQNMGFTTINGALVKSKPRKKSAAHGAAARNK